VLIGTRGKDDRNDLYSYWKISTSSLNEFQTSLSYEAWENVFSNNDNDTNTIFNNFLNTFLRTFNANFPQKRTKFGWTAEYQSLVNNWHKNIM
jgi:hypothetical protein